MSGRLSDHIAAVGEWGMELNYTELVADTLKELRIALGPRGFVPSSQNKIYMHPFIELEPYASLPLHCEEFYTIGAFSYSWSLYPPGTKVGRYCSIAGDGAIFIGHHPLNWASTSNASFMNDDIAQKWAIADLNGGVFTPHPYAGEQPYPTIENDIWIGRSVLIRPTITIGTGAIIAAGSVVTKDVPPYAIIGGNPARVIRMRVDEKYIEPLLASRWWDYDIRILTKCRTPDIDKFLDDFERWKQEDNIRPYAPKKITFHEIIQKIAELARAKNIEFDLTSIRG